MEQETFGCFLKRKRLEREITLRGFAGMLDISPVYLCDLEKDRVALSKTERLKQIADLLRLDTDDTDKLYDLAALARSRPAVSGDLPDYIMENEIVRVALRTAKDADATDAEWQEFIEKLNKRIIPNRRPKDGG
ncbi:hypothetical protein FACS1894202_02450 [Clostridia bacterium]|nr:hypothetical protein FACS1894202_02450 [Clostridia bacterium]